MPNALNAGFSTGGMVAAPIAGRIISKIVPTLEVETLMIAGKEANERLCFNISYSIL